MVSFGQDIILTLFVWMFPEAFSSFELGQQTNETTKSPTPLNQVAGFLDRQGALIVVVCYYRSAHRVFEFKLLDHSNYLIIQTT